MYRAARARLFDVASASQGHGMLEENLAIRNAVR
jgi:hypothetical protein